ncbi:hypothetical protein K7432_010156 [Basidiobolus ranarum]|uniref:Uncharacterized protein n=1 Tax=Basidiobolus ranarum TaxID=34480 RepID=A0ABR2VVW5_9FUNG
MSGSTQKTFKPQEDPEFDAYVASLMARESRTRELNYQAFGVSAYKTATPSISKPKPNTRFLNALIRNTDGHNKALLRQDAEREREKRRHREGYRGDRKYRDDRDSRRTTRSNSRERTRSSSPHETRRIHSCSRSRDKRSGNAQSNENEYPSRNEEYAKRSRTSPELVESVTTIESAKKHKSVQQNESSSSNNKVSSSKMDKYFREDYDPRLDVEDFIMDNTSTIPEYTLFENTTESTKSKKMKKKHKKEKKKKKSKDKDLSPARKQSYQALPVTREWDLGKIEQTSWDPQLNPYMPSYK